jgi:hypothetical protein
VIKFASGRLACVLDSMFSLVALLEHLLLLIYHCYSGMQGGIYPPAGMYTFCQHPVAVNGFVWHLAMEFNRSMSCSDMCDFLVGRIPQEAVDILRGK